MLRLEKKIMAELKRLELYIYDRKTLVKDWVARRGYYKEPQKYEMLDQEWEAVPEMGRITGRDITVFLKNKVVLSEKYSGQTVVLLLKVGGEGCIRVNGEQHSGLDRNRNMVLLSRDARPGEGFDLEVEAYCKDSDQEICIIQSELAVIRQPVWDYYFDVKTGFEFIEGCPEEYIRQKMFRMIYVSLLMLDYSGDSPEEESVMAARAAYREGLSGFEQIKLPLTMYFAGHSHIDVAWQWPLKETVRKVGRTFPSMLRLMEQYPEFKFCQSMPVLYEMAKEYYPEVYAQIKERVEEGRWEPLGCMYLESDCNLVSGESFVRQILYGKKFWKQEFNKDSRVCFLPDVFGFSAALPQILKKTGTDYFYTTKLVWNETNEFPYSVFRWRGLDGTEVLAGMAACCSKEGLNLYNGDLSAPGVRMSLDLIKNKADVDSVMYLYGYGDGGGGVTKEMLESVARLDKEPMMPKVQIGTVEQYFDHLDPDKEYPVWSGELYFEKHRGTYTSIARNKRNNRKSELLYRDAEILSCFRYLVSGEFGETGLESGWKKILLNQFHDILPGTSISEVYEESERQYEEIFQMGAQSVQKSLEHLTEREEDARTVFNTLSWNRSQVVMVDGRGRTAVKDWKGNYPMQHHNTDGTISFLAKDVPSMGYRVYYLTDIPEGIKKECEPTLVKTEDGILAIDNAWLHICMNEKGEIISLFDKKAQRSILKEAMAANRLKLQEDIPVEWGAAWETTRKRDDKQPMSLQACKLTVEAHNGLYTKLVLEGVIHHSAVKQNIIIYHHGPYIAFETQVDWKERQRCLRVSFPVEISTMTARCDAAFGNTQHPTHSTTSQDEAQFEVCAHKWGDLSDGGYGVALMNDCKYGYSFQDCDMELNLLRSPDFPAENCDSGIHSFTYWLYPHIGDYKEGKVAQTGYEANVPLLVQEGAVSGGEDSFITTDCANIIIDTLKPAEDGNSMILRFFETYNTVSTGKIRLAFPMAECVETDLLENEIGKVNFMDKEIAFTVKPYEIITLKLRFF